MSDTTTHVTKLLNGKGLASKRRATLKQAITDSRRQPSLAVLLIGQDVDHPSYQQFLQQAAEVGVFVDTIVMKETVSERKLHSVIEKLNRQKNVHGIVVQLPLPEQFDSREIGRFIDPEKDVDSLHPDNSGWLMQAAPRYLPSMAHAIWSLLEAAHIDVAGKHAVVIGASNIIGKPIALQLMNHGATVTVCHSRTEDKERFTRQADILISATGTPHSVTAEMVKPGSIVIDAGITVQPATDDGQPEVVLGDVDFEAVSPQASYITPVPDGVTPMIVVALLEQTFQAMCDQEGIGM